MLLLSYFLLLLPRTTPPATWCTDGPASAWAMSALIQTVEAPGAEGEQMRRLYSLPRVARDSVVHITDERLCERAATAYYRDTLGPPMPGGVTVARIGNRYAVYGGIRAGEWTIMTIFSMDFEPITNIAM